MSPIATTPKGPGLPQKPIWCINCTTVKHAMQPADVVMLALLGYRDRAGKESLHHPLWRPCIIRPLWPCTIRCCPEPSAAALHHPLLPCITRCCPAPSAAALHHSLWPCTIRCCPASSAAALHHPLRPCIIRCCPASFAVALHHPLLP